MSMTKDVYRKHVNFEKDLAFVEPNLWFVGFYYGLYMLWSVLYVNEIDKVENAVCLLI